MVLFLNPHKVGYTKTVSSNDLAKFLKCEKQHNVESCEPNSSMLGAELAYDPKIKVVALLKYYNFDLVHTSMQRLYDIVQPRSNIPFSNDDLHYNYDLEIKLALVMNTKVVHSDILNIFKVFLRSHKHFIHWLHIILPRSTSISSLRSLIR